ncbi:hypothetical protein M0R45_034631 [Rubus argutus]|uniref:Secreted protein n=1 Tax=Rubus argutus TaxID=59490 RepID=A0AAW1VT50_RUBAR
MVMVVSASWARAWVLLLLFSTPAGGLEGGSRQGRWSRGRRRRVWNGNRCGGAGRLHLLVFFSLSFIREGDAGCTVECDGWGGVEGWARGCLGFWINRDLRPWVVDWGFPWCELNGLLPW